MQRVPDHPTAVELSGDDPWVRWAVAAPLTGEVWVHDGVLLVERTGPRRGFWVAPPAATATTSAPAQPADDGQEQRARVQDALVALRDGGHLQRLASRTVSVVQGYADVATEVLDLADGGRWDWMWVDTSSARLGLHLPVHPVQTHPGGLVELDDTDDANEISTFTARHHDRVWTEIGTGRVCHWVGLRNLSGELIAVGGAEREASGVPHLAGIVTDCALRGRGLGTIITAGLTAWALADSRVCTLGMFSDNDRARSIYTRLGYRTARAWHSRALRRVP